MKKEICHVCKKEKKPYLVILSDSIFSLMHHERAREDGPICERCNNFFAMTGEFKDVTDEEFELTKKACEFARNMLIWWEKDEKMDIGDVEDTYSMPNEEKNKRDWGGLVDITKWYRNEFRKPKIKRSGVKNG